MHQASTLNLKLCRSQKLVFNLWIPLIADNPGVGKNVLKSLSCYLWLMFFEQVFSAHNPRASHISLHFYSKSSLLTILKQWLPVQYFGTDFYRWRSRRIYFWLSVLEPVFVADNPWLKVFMAGNPGADCNTWQSSSICLYSYQFLSKNFNPTIPKLMLMPDSPAGSVYTAAKVLQVPVVIWPCISVTVWPPWEEWWVTPRADLREISQ